MWLAVGDAECQFEQMLSEKSDKTRNLSWTLRISHDRRIDQQRPGVDAALQIGEIPEPLLPEVLGRLLTADAVVTLKHERRVPIPMDQLVMIFPI